MILSIGVLPASAYFDAVIFIYEEDFKLLYEVRVFKVSKVKFKTLRR